MSLIGIKLILQATLLFFITFSQGFNKFSKQSAIYSIKRCNLNMGPFFPGANAGPSSRTPAAPPPPINEYIKADKVRLIVPGNETGDEIMIGIFPLREAIQRAEELEMDLVLINDKADPPVCKVIDYGKFKYAKEKKEKENLKKQVKQDIKEVKMSYKIDQHDFDVRLRAIQKFIGDGDRVKVVIQFKGREMQYQQLGRDLLLKLFQPMEGTAAMESNPKVEGKAISMLLGPKKKI